MVRKAPAGPYEGSAGDTSSVAKPLPPPVGFPGLLTTVVL
jgi:hypothetical protein